MSVSSLLSTISAQANVMNIGQTTFIYSSTKVISYAIGFVATIYYARVVGEDILGIYFLALAVVSWIGIGARLGFSQAVKKRLSEGNEPSAFFTAGAITVILMFFTVSLITLIFNSQLTNYIGASVISGVLILLAGNLLYNFSGASLQGRHLVHVYAGLSLLKRISRNILQITLITLGLGLTGLIYGYAIGWFLAGILALAILRIRPTKPSFSHFKDLFDYAKYAWLGSIRGRSFRWVDISVLGFFVSSGLVGIYSIAWTVAAFLQIFSNAITTTVFPEISKKSKKDGLESVANLVNVSLAYAGFIIIPGLVGGYLIGDRLLLLYGNSFTQGTRVLTILIAGVLIYSYQKQLLTALGAVDRPDLAFRVNAVFIAANVIFNVVLIWQFGWIGAAIATGLASIIGLCYSLYHVRRLVPLRLPYKQVSEQIFASLSMGVILYLLKPWLNNTRLSVHNELFVPSLVLCGAFTYAAALLIVSSDLRTIIKNNLPFRT